jgi:hypothetical protein
MNPTSTNVNPLLYVAYWSLAVELHKKHYLHTLIAKLLCYEFTIIAEYSRTPAHTHCQCTQ